MKELTDIIFTDSTPEKIGYSVILSMHRGKWVFVKHKERDTYEIPGGRLEGNETPLDAAKRELYEETGAKTFTIRGICYYGVKRPGSNNISYGSLFFANITEFDNLPDFEMTERIFTDTVPENMTYPDIQPLLHKKGVEWLAENSTVLYMVRHAKPDYTYEDDATRPLLQEGIEAAQKLVDVFADIHIDTAYSSPYVRSVDTIKPICEAKGILIATEYDLRERKVGESWISDDDFKNFALNQWSDFDYKLEDGESLRRVQQRNIAALNKILKENERETIIVGTHGTALSTILNHYHPDFGYEESEKMKPKLPYIFKLRFILDEFIDGLEILCNI